MKHEFILGLHLLSSSIPQQYQIGHFIYCPQNNNQSVLQIVSGWLSPATPGKHVLTLLEPAGPSTVLMQSC